MPGLESTSSFLKVVERLQITVDNLEVDLRKRLIGRSMPAWSYSWVVEPHYHGVAVRLLYKRTSEGTYALEEAATRGDGLQGSDITHHALSAGIVGLPAALTTPPSAPHGSGTSSTSSRSSGSGSSSNSISAADTSIAGGGDGVAASPAVAGTASSAATPGSSADRSEPEWLEVRGEVFLTPDDVKQVNAELEAAGQPPFPSGRKAAAAALKLPDPDQCRTRRLSFVAYEALSLWVAATDADEGSAEPRPVQGGTQARPLHSSHWRTLQWLEAAGFAVSPDNMLCLSLEEAVEEAARFMSVEAPLDYDTEGVVIKFGDTGKYGIGQGTAADGGGGGGGGATPPSVAWAYNPRQRAARQPSAMPAPGKQAGAGSGVRSLTGVAGLTFCITGTLEGTTRTEMQNLLKVHGAAVRDTVTSYTDVLLVGASPGANKLKAARSQRHVKVVTEEQFWEQYIQGNAPAAGAGSSSAGRNTGAAAGGGSGSGGAVVNSAATAASAASAAAAAVSAAAVSSAAAAGSAAAAASPRQLTHILKLGRNVRGSTISVTGTLKGPFGAGLSRDTFQAWLEAAGAIFHENPKKGRQGRPTQILVVGAASGDAKVDKARAWGVTIMDEKDFWQWALQ